MKRMFIKLFALSLALWGACRMALEGRLTFVDAYNRTTQRSFEMVDATLADAGTDLTALRTALTAISDMGYTKELLTESTDLDVAAVAETNVDEGLSVKVRLVGGGTATVSIPAPKKAKLNADGSMPTDDADLVAFFNLFGMDEPTTPAVATIYNGKKVASIISAKLDK